MNENLIVSLKDIVVDFDGQKVLDGLSLDIHDKEFVTFLGPSGCGKTTTLRVIAGFVTPKSGNVFFDGKAQGAAAAAHTTPMCQGRKDLPYRCTHKIHYTVCRMFVNKNFLINW